MTVPRPRAAPSTGLFAKIWQLNWLLILILSGLASVGFAMLYSAAEGSMEPWASRQIVRFGMGFVIMLIMALVPLRFWLRAAYPFYLLTLVLLVAVEVIGSVGMGAQRWLDLGFFQLQPSELVKIAMVLALARFYHGLTQEDAQRLLFLVPPLLLLLVPIALVAKQPDLGTALMLGMAAAAMLWLAGVRWWLFALGILAVAGAAPVAWNFLRDYQKARVLTFLDPSRDPLGSGYHIIQSKIALGSGGIEGKGFMLGTQSHLNFLPEKQTDFIFTMFAEEFGLIGGLALLGGYLLVMIYGYLIAFRAHSHFGRLIAVGLTTNLFLNVFINTAMVMGMIPAKGVPLPLISYGGTSMLTALMAAGLIMCVWVNRDNRLTRHSDDDEPG